MPTLLQKERAQQKINIDAVNAFIDPDHETTQAVFQELIRDPVLISGKEWYDLEKSELRQLAVEKIGRLATYIENDSPDEFFNRMSLLSISDPAVSTRLGVNLSLFINAIRGNGTDAQAKYWLFDRGTAQIRGIYGCFSMTELAHGSNVAGLQTTATYNPERKSFIINTPNLGATKWWIGGAAHSSNHTVVFARLISGGKDYGVKCFVVQLRDSDFNLLPGINIGDIGGKMGRNAIDNGWIQFTNVEIPKEYFLQRFCTIDDDGTVHNTPMEQLGLSALLQGRVNMVLDSARHGAKHVTIALRYGIGRQQFGDPKNETQIMNYALHQYRLVPYLAAVYLLAPASQKLLEDYDSILNSMYEGGDIEQVIFNLKNLFVNSASLKSSNTWLISQLIDEARQACGGHGYSSYSGLGQAFSDWSVQQTWEGDNNVLAINAGRSIIKYYQAAQKGQKIGVEFSYLTKKLNNFKFCPKGSLESFIDVFGAIIIKLAQHSLKIYNNDWDSVSQERLAISKFHNHHYLLTTFYNRLQQGKVSGVEKDVLILLFKLYSLFQIDKTSGVFLQFGIIDAVALGAIQAELKKILGELRPHLCGLTDAFKYPDQIINSSLGNYDGDFENHYFDDINVLNKRGTKPPYLPLLGAMLGRGTQDERLFGSRTDEHLAQMREDDE